MSGIEEISVDIKKCRENKEVVLGKNAITLGEFVAVAKYHAKVKFSEDYVNVVNRSRGLVEKFLEENRIVYGLTTGFGDNVTKIISPKDSETLQKNIVLSHSCSIGEPLDKEVVRGILLMMLLNLGKGYSGVRIEVLELVKEVLNRDITPYVPGEGSVALTVPAGISLILVGEGKAWYNGRLVESRQALESAGLKPARLTSREGLALSSGSTSQTALAALTVYYALNAAKTADIAGSLSFQGLKGTLKCCDPRLHSVKLHSEQAATANNLNRLLKDSEVAEKYLDYRVQDAVSLRQIPQMHGAAKKILKECFSVVMNEINSCSDNPILYPEGEDGIALMGANFDDSFVGIYMDSACIGMGTLAKISERRIDRLVNRHHSELPPFLVLNPGLNNGYMMPQYTAAALVGEIKILSHPSTVDSIPTTAGQEDVMSFTYYGAKKAYQVVKKLEYILAIELMISCQALDCLSPLKPSPATKAVYDLIRSLVPKLDDDRYLWPDIENIFNLVHNGEIVNIVEKNMGVLAF